MSKPPHLKTELKQAGRFGIVGLAATVVHLLLAQAALSAGAEPVTANIIGFLFSFLVGLVGHYRFTFKMTRSFGRATARYGLIAIAGFLINNVVLLTLVSRDWLREDIALAVAILIVPAGTFIASRFWGFAALRPDP